MGRSRVEGPATVALRLVESAKTTTRGVTTMAETKRRRLSRSSPTCSRVSGLISSASPSPGSVSS
jgi:hypothetical protein